MTRLGSQGELRTYLDGRLQAALVDVENHDAERLRFDQSAAIDYVVERASLEKIVVDWSSLSRSEPRETTIRRREFGETYDVAAQRVDFFVPVSGDAQLLAYRASTYTLSAGPDVEIARTEITFSMTSQQLDPAQMKSQVENLQARVTQAVGRVNEDVEQWLQQLRAHVAQAASQRKQRLDAAADFSGAFDIPVRSAPGARQIQVPVARKTVRVVDQAANNAAPTSEPRLADAIYEDVVRTLRAVGNSFERLPRTATKFNEEELRDVLLFILNSNFEGSARGEVFNGAGKTDILIQHQDRNAFIGECKVWHGEKKFAEAIDQLVSYTVWRDTKAALILFIRGGDATDVLAKADVKLRSHPQFAGARTSADSDARTDYLLRATDDQARLIHVALLPFVLRDRDEVSGV
ncbi:MAG: hypothetical protein BGO38_17810 [Cellulomonas sp. 73-145]|uniref:hypothetical protein n=1 Tax=Cellulomonas sp. 73-145 TaxID=1895739 RepID=UPI0009275826|nr:hypothetical protein [Cellulomonas sp. 73-145]OJV59123.1 MAG: hypothetical protein BGO38_17810 [Cellulomonas sp. 73-145]